MAAVCLMIIGMVTVTPIALYIDCITKEGDNE